VKGSGRFWLAVAVVTVCLVYVPAVTSAATYAQLYAAQRAEQATQGRISANSYTLNNTEKQLYSLKVSLNQLEEAISSTEREIAHQQALLTTLRQQEQVEQHKKQELVQQFNAILVNNYENGGSLNYLSVLLGATSWSDFIDRLHELKLILLYNIGIQQQIIKEDQLIAAQEVSITQNMDKLQAMVDQSNQLAKVKEESISKENAVLSGLSQRERLLEEEKAGELADINNIQRELLAQEEEAKLYARYGPIKSSGVTPAITAPVHLGAAGISSLINYAESFLGTPYVWGGTSPDPGFDCSGFTQFVLRHFGVAIQRTSEQQYQEGVPVDRGNLEPGDLVFFTTYAPGASHVGLYIGNGLMVDAEDYGVVFDNINNGYWSPRYLGARRIVEP